MLLCPLFLPCTGMTDIQVSAKDMAIQSLAERPSIGKVSIFAHSQGALDTQGALDWLPSTHSLVIFAVYNLPDLHGTSTFPSVEHHHVKLCDGNVCLSDAFPTVRQLAHDRLIAKDGRYRTRTHFSFYVIEDEVAQLAAESSTVQGAQISSIQSVCPLQVRDHFIMIIAHPAVQLMYAAMINKTLLTSPTFPLSFVRCA
ncbi:hypothetical protein K437DRAFT_171117 [Tilletiaria anomala UBC 951]|uniref:Uncharacterized protein n=1 Tax=Tilletiaria anomala (strain ATCC 24038 / CBS 436.72 / UBC 951) TaxID=1037660 RepID=A0A066VSW0_TILAU|nr:uncharacterized protein K437DRAFT_171117 [Tilletiaria anomala UBC 951]KDN41670.1 hypothetical protein K437DRAFT_171117 [Tilletiaria anomala UBC 951]